MQLAPRCSDDVLQNTDLLAVLIIEPRHALIDVADDFVVDRAQHVRNALAWQERSVLVVAEERRGRADLGLGNIRNIDHAHIHADSADDGCLLAADAEGDAVGKKPAQAVCVADGKDGNELVLRCRVGSAVAADSCYSYFSSSSK